MKGKWNTRKVVALTLVTLLTLLGSTASIGSAAPAAQDAVASVAITPTRITWTPLVKNGGSTLTISGPDYRLQKTYGAGARPTFRSTDSAGNPLADGLYTYELQLLPVGAGDARPRVDDAERGIVPAGGEEALVQAGAFAVAGGRFVTSTVEMDDEDLGTALDGAGVDTAPADICYADDLIVDGSFCVGFDCICNMSFGFDTIVLRENNLRIFFDDTSTAASFPRNDWRITINSSDNGGAAYFGIDDATGGRSPFRIEAGAPNYSLYVDDGGRVGFGTSTPYVEAHIKDSDTPTVRLEQDNSGGWTPQTWDVAGNETNFFIRDVTNGSKLPFRIQPGADSNALTIKSDNNVGIGTWTPGEKLHVEGNIYLPWDHHITSNGNVNLDPPKDLVISIDSNNDETTRVFKIMKNAPLGGGTELFRVQENGNVGIGTTSPGYLLHVNGSAGKPGGGTWDDSSDARLKENIHPIDGRQALDLLNQLQGVTFEWINPGEHSAGTRASLVAQDVEKVFPDWVEEYDPQRSDAELIPEGEKAKAIHFPHDFNAYTIEAIKALDAQNQALAETVEEQDAKIAALEQQNADLEARLTALEESAGVTKSRTYSLPLGGLFLGGLLVVGVVASRRRK
jgi:hypothetical protein